LELLDELPAELREELQGDGVLLTQRNKTNPNIKHHHRNIKHHHRNHNKLNPSSQKTL
jgi:hypothetical protein